MGSSGDPIRPLVAEILNIYLLIGQGGKAAACLCGCCVCLLAREFEKKKKTRAGPGSKKTVIFDIIDINQAQDESVVRLKARFSCVFASLKMGGVAIDSALQVGFMLRALLSSYHGVVQDFRLGRHSLSTATLQTVVDQRGAMAKTR